MLARKSLPIGVMVLVLIVALASLGVVYGMWQKTLFINGTVQTGQLDAEMSIEGVPWDNELPEKDFATCVAALTGTNQSRDTLDIQIGNAYPSYRCWVTFDVHNTGTIPIHVDLPVLNAPAEVTVALRNCYTAHYQLHPTEKVLCTLEIHLEQAAAQGATYLFDGTVYVHQYNEEP